MKARRRDGRVSSARLVNDSTGYNPYTPTIAQQIGDYSVLSGKDVGNAATKQEFNKNIQKICIFLYVFIK